MGFQKDKKKKNRGTLILEGSLTIQRIFELRDLFLSVPPEATEVDLDFKDTADADLTSLQLLCSAHRTYVKAGRSLHMPENIPEALERTMEDGGFRLKRACRYVACGPCMFVKEGVS